jgi:eukaryotic-like serine/threonine-protein kinase
MVMAVEQPPKVGWRFEAGDPILSGRRALDLLGGGERYEAYVAWNERLLSPTVIKILRPTFVDDPRARRAMANEAAILSRLEHPGLTRLFDMDADGDRPFIELEYLEGPRLSTLVRRHGRLNPEQAFPLGRQLASTLHYLHQAGLVHLDVKPSNIIMGPLPRLIDLSVARAWRDGRRVGGFIGTDAYMSPEQADPDRWQFIGPASDLWGLGVTLYEAVAKRMPYQRGDHGAAGSARFPQLAAAPVPLDPLRHSPGLSEAVMSTLCVDPAERPSAARLFDRFDELATLAGVSRVSFR